MTQTAERKITYPKGRMVVVRDCTVAICCNHNSGATLLSTLLFWYDHPQKYDTYNDEEHTFTVCRTQAEIEEAACHQIDAKTIHDSAVPLLHLFGYLIVKEKMNGNLYTIHMDQVFAAYAAYEQGAKATRTFLKSQLEKTLIDVPSVQLEEMLIKKRKLSLQLEKTLIQLRENSHCKRGRKTKPKEAAEEVSEKDRILENFRDSNKIDSLVTSASAESDGGVSFLSQLRSFEETLKDVQNGQAPLYTSCIPTGHEEEPVKPAGTSLEPATSAANDTTNVPQEIPTPEQPTEPLFPAAQPLPGNKTHRKDNRKISVLSVPKVPPRVIREAIDAIRGYGLDQEGPIKHQGVILKEWCQKHTLEDFQHVIEHLTKGRCSNEKHQWWREKNHMKTFFNAAKLAELTPDILSELGHIPKPEAPPEVAPSVEEPKIVGWTPVRQIYPPKGVTVTYGS